MVEISYHLITASNHDFSSNSNFCLSILTCFKTFFHSTISWDSTHHTTSCGVWLSWLLLTSNCVGRLSARLWHRDLKPIGGGERRVLQISKTRTEEIKCRCFNNLPFILASHFSRETFEKVPQYPESLFASICRNNQTCIDFIYFS